MSENIYNAIVAGAGIWGCTVARRLAEAGKKVLVLEKRPVVGGNVRCEIDPETGIEIHTYGSHIFHTHLPEVWQFVNRFVSFNGYQHKVIARTRALPPGADERLRSKVEVEGGRNYYLPLGLSLINKFFDVELKPSEVDAFLDENIPSSTSTSNLDLSPRRAAIFDAFFRGYTSKQWGKAPEDIDPTIIKRVPVRNTYDVNYFNDYWQGIPSEGYNKLFEKLLDHPNIEVKTSASLRLVQEVGREIRSTKDDCIFVVHNEQTGEETPLSTSTSHLDLYYSGPIDALFDYKFGPLPWRTLRFETETVNCADYQGTSVVNYTEASVPYTRIHEFKHYHPEPIGPLSQAESLKTGKKTIIMREYSANWKLGDEPYYPVNNTESAALLAQYQAEAAKVPEIVIGGRLGMYKYFDMDKSIEAALKVEIA